MVFGLKDRRSLGEFVYPYQQTVAQAFQPVQAQAKACGYKNSSEERNSI